MRLGAGAEQHGMGDSDNLVMPSNPVTEQSVALRGKGLWEVTELVRNILNGLSKFDEQGLTPLPFTLEEIDDSLKFPQIWRRTGQSSDGPLPAIIALRKGELGLLADLCGKFEIDPTKPYAACPDLFGEVSERVGIWSLAVAVIRSVTTMSEDQLRRFWSTPEITMPNSNGKYSSPEQDKFDLNSLQKEYPTIKPYLPWLKRSLSVEANSRFDSISEASDYWDMAVLSQPGKQTLPKGEIQVVRGWSFTGTKVTKKFEGELSLDSSGRFFCVVEKGVVKVFEISPIPNGKRSFILISQKRVGDFGTSSIDWDRWEQFVSGTSEQGNIWKIDLPTKAHDGSIWIRDHLVRNDDPMRAIRDFCQDWAAMSSSPEEREDRKKKIQEMRQTKAWQEQHDLYQINGTVDVQPGKEQLLIKARLRIDGGQYKLPRITVDIGERGAHIKPFCTARWCGFVMEDSFTKPTSTSHLFLVNRTSGVLHRRRFPFSDFEVNEHFLVGFENGKGGGKITVIW